MGTTSIIQPHWVESHYIILNPSAFVNDAFVHLGVRMADDNETQ